MLSSALAIFNLAMLSITQIKQTSAACHGGVIDAIFRHLLGAPVTGRFQLQAANTSITEFLTTGTAQTPFGHAREMWRLVRYNDAAHLAGLPIGTQRA